MDPARSKKPAPFIFVTGVPRSGTTFVGRMLALPSHVGFIDEPFSADFGMPQMQSHFVYLRGGKERRAEYDKLIDDLVRGRARYRKLPPEGGRNLKATLGRALFGSGMNFGYLSAMRNPMVNRYIVKDPTASLMARYLHEAHGFPTLIMLRHPAAVAASFRRVDLHHPFADLTGQPDLMKDYLKDILGKTDPSKLPDLEQAALLWKCLNIVLLDFAKANPTMQVLRHEDVSFEPHKHINDLYKHFELPYSERIDEAITEHTGHQNPTDPTDNAMHVLQRDSRKNATRWHKLLTKDELRTIRDITGDVGESYYPRESWEIDG